MTNNLMTVFELARYLKLDPRILCRYLRAHPLAEKDAQLPAIRIGGRWRFHKEDIDRWLLRHAPFRAHGRQQSRILVVDDDENFRSMLLELLETSGYMAHGVEDGEAALALLREMAFDLLLVDLRMPGMGGIELIREAKNLHPDARFIILTGYGDTKSAIEGLSLGATDILEKPIRDLRALESAVELALSHQTGRPSTEAGVRNPFVNVTRGESGIRSRVSSSQLSQVSLTLNIELCLANGDSQEGHLASSHIKRIWQDTPPKLSDGDQWGQLETEIV